jgi:NOL1/NOP2/sun family putative RNA methylase
VIHIPPQLIQSLKNVPGFEEESFIKIHLSGQQVTSIRTNPAKFNIDLSALNITSPVPWCETGYYLEARPSFTFDPLFHGGAYYVQEASSMFLEQAIKQHMDLSKSLRVLDLCAAPGGKSTHLLSLLSSNSLLVSNEVIKSRVNILEENLAKWGGTNTIVTNNDPQQFAAMENYFDLIVIDAPCSGSGLFRKDPDAVKEWSEANVEHCSRRQQRILTDIWPALKENGILIYSTCSYSTQEDEEILDWLSEHGEAASLRLQPDPSWQIIETTAERSGAYGYRFFPDKIQGEGFFIACMQKISGEVQPFLKPRTVKYEKCSRKERSIIEPWISQTDNLELFRIDDSVHAFPVHLLQDLGILQSKLYIKKSGVRVGKIMGEELVPDHELALGGFVDPAIQRISLSKENALKYLRREEIRISSGKKGWALVTYHELAIGWIKNLGNRINNYFPKSLRILKREE